MTSKKKSHPSVQQFKEFVKKHPKLVQEVRKGNKDWQEVFEDWYLLGENDVVWKQYRDGEQEQEDDKKDSKADFMSQMLSAVKKMDMNTVNHHITNMSSTISTIQGLFDQFGSSKGTNQQATSNSQNPFTFRKD
ncbi:cytosolic protein [Metabacillus litoralis]|uniref:Cytosolic protein n=1 Tax=Metabacillus litoralis TaxID=152268 RepID=A0A5C6W879_9BACI|nr:YlbD family protein [Metabacillus litoralis]TXC92079.1 cytosolic protein [Metabacillus litoralis]